MEGTYTLNQGDPDFSKIYDWWDCCTDDSKEERKKQKKKRRKAKKKAKKKARKKAEKKAKQKLKYELIEKSASTLISTAADIARMYAKSKFQRSGEKI